MELLAANWTETVGEELGACTRPFKFTGAKSRRLVVNYVSGTKPPWGDWASLSHIEPQRRVFTRFRAAVNSLLSPHEVDHIEFIAEEVARDC